MSTTPSRTTREDALCVAIGLRHDVSGRENVRVGDVVDVWLIGGDPKSWTGGHVVEQSVALVVVQLSDEGEAALLRQVVEGPEYQRLFIDIVSRDGVAPLYRQGVALTDEDE